MDNISVMLIIIFTFAGLVVVVSCVRGSDSLKTFGKSAAAGISSLLILKLCSGFFGFSAALNIFTFIVSAVLGIPGAVGTAVLSTIYGI